MEISGLLYMPDPYSSRLKAPVRPNINNTKTNFILNTNVHTCTLYTYNELSQKKRFESVPIVAFFLYNIQRENLFLKKSLYLD